MKRRTRITLAAAALTLDREFRAGLQGLGNKDDREMQTEGRQR